MPNEFIAQAPNINFTPLSEIAEDISYLDYVLPLGRANFPSIDSLKVGMAALIDDEIMSVQSIGYLPGTITVLRGCADTVPAEHQAGSLVWFMDTTTVGSDKKEHAAGEDNDVKYSTFTIGGGSMSPSDDQDSLTYDWRWYRPYPPGQVRIEGQRWFADGITIGTENPVLSLTWVHRDRVLQSDQLIDHDAPNVGPEPGCSYTIRIYNSDNVLKRTEVGVMADAFDSYGHFIPPHYEYTWDMAMTDLDAIKQDGALYLPATMTVHATRDGFDSWQFYEIKFEVNIQGYFLKVAQFMQQGGQAYYEAPPDPGNEPPPDHAIFAGQIVQQAGQAYIEGEDGQPPSVGADGMFVAQLAQGIAQPTSFYTPMTRNLFEAPYAFLSKRSILSNGGASLVTVAARPSDRLTDTHVIYTRNDRPEGEGASFPYLPQVEPTFTPWITIGANINYLDSVVVIERSSFYDGVSLESVVIGQVAMLDNEVVRVDAKDATTITIARGCYDTVPAPHYTGARMWFIDASAGVDPSEYPVIADEDGVLGAGVQVKMVPRTYGVPLDPSMVPTDRLNGFQRVQRPYPPGNVLVAGAHWYAGRVITEGMDTHITWNHRSREVQGGNAVDHLDGMHPTPEDNQRYRLSISLSISGTNGHPATLIKVREEIVEGEEFMYTYAMAYTDGYRAGQLLKACGRVTVGMVLETVRDSLYSWQYYVIPLSLPSYLCPPNKPPGGGQLPQPGGGGSGGGGGGGGTIGGGGGGGGYTPPPSGGTNPGGGGGGGDNTGDGPGGNDGGGGGDNGGGSLPPPPVLPPDWPDPVDPPPEPPGPTDPNPNLGEHWDKNWDRHWDAYNKDNQGG